MLMACVYFTNTQQGGVGRIITDRYDDMINYFATSFWQDIATLEIRVKGFW